MEDAAPGSAALIKTRYGQGYSFEGRATHIVRYLNEDCFGALIDTSPGFIVVKDEHGKWLTANLAAQTFFRLQDRHCQGKSDLELAASLPEFSLMLGTLTGSSDDVWKNKTPLKTLKSIAESGGSTRHFEVVQTPIFHADGTPNVLMISGCDITDSCAADAKAQLADQLLKNSRDPLVITDASNTIVSINHAFTAVTGYTENEVVGKNPRVFASGCHPPEFYRSMWDRIYIEGAWCGEIWDKKKNGELYQKWLDIKVVRDSLGCPKNYLGIYSDPTDQQTAQRINSS
jgi:PAS domain S-box-containing protein